MHYLCVMKVLHQFWYDFCVSLRLKYKPSLLLKKGRGGEGREGEGRGEEARGGEGKAGEEKGEEGRGEEAKK